MAVPTAPPEDAFTYQWPNITDAEAADSCLTRSVVKSRSKPAAVISNRVEGAV